MSNSEVQNQSGISWALGLGLSLGFSVLLYVTVVVFLKAFAWASIVVLMTWPIRTRLKLKSNCSDGLVALIMSASLGLLLLCAIVPIGYQLAQEIGYLSVPNDWSLERAKQAMERVPYVGSIVSSNHLIEMTAPYLKGAGEPLVRIAARIANGLLEAFFTISMALFFSFFLYRNGATIARGVKVVLLRYGGRRFSRYLILIEHTVKGVVYGAIVTALAQGVLAGIGLWVAGAPFPIMLGLLTVILSCIPFGAPLVYVPASIYLLLSAESWLPGCGLLMWGVLVVSTIDNLLRPLFISQATQMSVALILVGIVGGILTFGLIGLFIGPATIAIAQAIWSEVVTRSEPADLKLNHSDV